MVISKGNDETARVTSGTYIHPDLVPALAMWLSPDFFLKACKILNDYITSYWKSNCEKLKKENRLKVVCKF